MESLDSSAYGPITSQCQYDWGGHSSLDIEVDASGLWFMYGRASQQCFLTVSKVKRIDMKYPIP